MQADTIEEWLVSRVAAMLNVSEQEVDRTVPFTSLGLDSVTLFGLTGELAEWLGRDLSAPLAWEFPTIEGLARQLAESSDHIEERSILHAPRDQPIPLSYSQERLWLNARAHEEGDLDFIVQQWSVRGELHVERLKSSLNEVVCRHEILRTTFSEVEGQPVQVIHSPGSVIMYLLDLSDSVSPSEEAERQLRGESQRVMNLERGPLFRVVVLRLANTHHKIIFSIHHLLYDATSLGIFYRDLSAIYAAHSGGSSDLGEPPLQTADFAVWQRDWLRRDGDRYQKLMAWWKQYWSGMIPRPIELPFRWTNTPQAPKLEESVIVRDIPGNLVDGVKTLAQMQGATNYMVFFAAFQVLLYQMTGQEQMIIGTYVSDRGFAAKNSLGFYVNLLSLRFDLGGSPAFVEIVARARDTLQLASIHQELPFEELAKELLAEGREVPWVQVIFQHLPDAEMTLGLSGVEVEQESMFNLGQMPWGFSMRIMQFRDSTKSRVTFDSGLYDPAGVAAISVQYETLLEALVADPEKRLESFSSGGRGCKVNVAC